MLAMTMNILVTPQSSGLSGGGAARSTLTASPGATWAAPSAPALPEAPVPGAPVPGAPVPGAPVPGAPVPGARSEPRAGEDDGTADTYSARTTFDAATGEWAFVIERHPPETGIPVAEQGGFVSQYAATVVSAADLRSAFNLTI